MQQLKAQIDKGRENLRRSSGRPRPRPRDAARNDYLTALRREESLKAVLGTQKSEAMALNTNAVEYKSLKTEVDAKRTMLDSLLKRQSETEAMSRSERGAAGERPRRRQGARRPAAPYALHTARNGVFGLLGGWRVGMGLAFLLSLLDRSIRTPEQVEQLLGLPALGVVPAVGGKTRPEGYASGLAPQQEGRVGGEGALDDRASAVSPAPVADRRAIPGLADVAPALASRAA